MVSGSAGAHGESPGVVGGSAGAAERSAGAAGRVAVVTGAARGIGAATVLALVEAGWSVLAVDCTADDPALPYPMATQDDLSGLVSQANEGAGAPGRVRSFVADVRNWDAVSAAVAEAEHLWGGLDAAVAAAGVIAGGVPLWEVPLAQQQAVLDVNLGGVLSLARAAIPALLRRPAPRSGRFLAVASAAATRGLPMLAANCAAKAGVAGLVRALAAEQRVLVDLLGARVDDHTEAGGQRPGDRAAGGNAPTGRFRVSHSARPPSTGTMAPVIPLLAGLARKARTAATSAGSSSRRIGCWLANAWAPGSS